MVYAGMFGLGTGRNIEGSVFGGGWFSCVGYGLQGESIGSRWACSGCRFGIGVHGFVRRGGNVFGTQSLWAKVLGPGLARFVLSGFGFC